MIIQLQAERSAIREFLRAKLQVLRLICLIFLPIGLSILVFRWELILLSLIAFSIPFILFLDFWEARRDVGVAGGVKVVCTEENVQLTQGEEQIILSYPEVAKVRWTPAALHVLWVVGANRYRKVLIPGRREAVQEVAEWLAGRGVPISRERSAHTEVLGLFGAVVSNRLFRLLAGGLVVGGLANIALAAAGVGGSFWLGVGLLLGALAALTVSELLGRVLLPER